MVEDIAYLKEDRMAKIVNVNVDYNCKYELTY